MGEDVQLTRAQSQAPRYETSALRLVLHADAAELAPMRRAVARWAERAALSEDSLADLQLALGEAAANGVEHAYRGELPGPVEIVVELRRRGSHRDAPVVAVRVADEGHWRPAPIDAGHRGRGLSMIRALADNVVLQPGRDGTVVCFEIPLAA